MRIGIMGGTFDPIHNGHLAIAKAAYEQFGLDKVWFLPNGNPPHKALTDIGSSIEDRIRMVELAIAGHTGFRLEAYEARRKSISCSYETMEHFTKTYPKDDFFSLSELILCLRLTNGCIQRDCFPLVPYLRLSGMK